MLTQLGLTVQMHVSVKQSAYEHHTTFRVPATFQSTFIMLVGRLFLRYYYLLPGLPGSHKQKRSDEPLKKAKSHQKSQKQDKYTTTPLKHPNVFLKGNIRMFCT